MPRGRMLVQREPRSSRCTLARDCSKKAPRIRVLEEQRFTNILPSKVPFSAA